MTSRSVCATKYGSTENCGTRATTSLDTPRDASCPSTREWPEVGDVTETCRALVSYIGGYQGAPVSHLIDVLGDARDLLDELGIYFESSAFEAGAAAMLGASINYPVAVR
jgi:hypothetical protein